MTDFSIVSGIYNDDRFLRVNEQLVKALNPNANFEWIAVNSMPENVDFDYIKTVAGVSGEKIKDVFNYKTGSIQHGMATNRGVMFTSGRFVCVMDHDFYIIQEDWIERVMSHMIVNDLAIFGAPYNPRWYFKYRDWPCIHFMVIDTEKIPKGALEFRPSLDEVRFQMMGKRSIREKLREYMLDINHPLKLRTSIGQVQDSGSQIHKEYKGKVKVDMVVPVLLGDLTNFYDRIIDLFVPRSMKLFPKKGTYTKHDFRVGGFGTMYGVEEYLWHDFPFAFHFRLFQADDDLIENGPDYAKQYLTSCLTRFSLEERGSSTIE